MSFGRPPSINIGFQTTPPQRGSFPLDHDGKNRLPSLRIVLTLQQVNAEIKCCSTWPASSTIPVPPRPAGRPANNISSVECPSEPSAFFSVHLDALRTAAEDSWNAMISRTSGWQMSTQTPLWICCSELRVKFPPRDLSY